MNAFPFRNLNAIEVGIIKFAIARDGGKRQPGYLNLNHFYSLWGFIKYLL